MASSSWKEIVPPSTRNIPLVVRLPSTIKLIFLVTIVNGVLETRLGLRYTLVVIPALPAMI